MTPLIPIVPNEINTLGNFRRGDKVARDFAREAAAEPFDRDLEGPSAAVPGATRATIRRSILCRPTPLFRSTTVASDRPAPTGPKRRLSTEIMGPDDKESAESSVESSPGPPSEWEQWGLPGHGRAARRPASRLWYTKPASRQMWSPPVAIASLRRGRRRAGRHGSGEAF